MREVWNQCYEGSWGASFLILHHYYYICNIVIFNDMYKITVIIYNKNTVRKFTHRSTRKLESVL